MKKTLVMLFFLLLATFLGIAIARHSGYVYIRYGQWQIEMTLWVALFLALALLLLCYIVWRFMHAARRLPQRWRQKKQWRQALKCQQLTAQAQTALLCGQADKAMHAFYQASKLSRQPCSLLLFAAIAASESDKAHYSDFIRRAGRRSQHKAIQYTQAYLQWKAGQSEQALATTEQLLQANPKDCHALKLASKIYQKTADWEKLQRLLPVMKKCQRLDNQALEAIRMQAYQAQLQTSPSPQAFESIWQTIDKVWQYQPALSTLYTKHLMQSQQQEKASEFIEAVLKQCYQEPLVLLYSQLQPKQLDKKQQHAEKWRAKHGEQAAIYYLLGQIYVKKKYWGQAEQMLQKSLAIEPALYTHKALVDLYRQSHEPEKLAQSYQALCQAITLPDMPLMEPVLPSKNAGAVKHSQTPG